MKYDYRELLGYQIIKSEVLVKRKLLRAFQESACDLTFEQWTVFNVIFTEPGLIQNEIAEKSFKDKTNVTRILDVLTKKNLIYRQKDDSDRRSYRIFLTSQGVELFNQLIPIVKKLNKAFVKDINKKDLETFYKVLSLIGKNAE